MLEIGILRNSSEKILGVPQGGFKGFGCPNDTQSPRHPAVQDFFLVVFSTLGTHTLSADI